MKLNDWLLQIGSNLFEKKEDLTAFTSNPLLKDVEIPDETAAKFDENYLSRSRALNDPDIIAKVNKSLKGQVYDMVDTRINKVIQKFSTEDQELIKNEPNTFKKIELMDLAITNISKNDDVKKVSETARKNEAALREKITELETSNKEKDATFDKKIKENQLDFALKNKIFGIELAPEFLSTKEVLADLKLATLKKNYVLQFDEKDQTKILLRQNVEGLIKEVYEGNKLVTLDDVLNKEYKDFTKKSTSGDTPPDQKKVVVVPQDKSTAGKTLREMQREGAANASA